MGASKVFHSFSRAALVPELEQGATLITPNRRLAARLKREYDTGQIKRNRLVWPTADVLSYNAFLDRTWAEHVCFEPAALLLSQEQETALWEKVIAASPQGDYLLNPTATARQAREAWAVCRAFRIELASHGAALDEDAATFCGWAERYGRICTEKNWIDDARLPDALAAGANALMPRQIILYGFDELAPQQTALFEALVAAGSTVRVAQPEEIASRAACSDIADTESELYAVAAQIKQILTHQPQTRIGVVVTDLAAHRGEIIRIFDDVLEPGRVLAASRERARPFNVSLGLPLADYPLVRGALLALELARGELGSHEISSLLRSPFLAAAEQEMAQRALLDAGLRERGQNRVTLAALLREARGSRAACPQLAAQLESWILEARKARKLKQAPSSWSGTLLALLKGLGWPGERTLDSEEYQTFEKCRERVSRLSALDAVTPSLSYDEAVAALRRLLSDALFQPESPEVPVQILGVLEANALQFDRLFVTGLCDEVWPPPSRPNPFLPIAVQRALNVPHASAEWQLDYAQRTTRQWLASAPEVLLTYPRRDGDRELRPSPLLDGLPLAALPETKPRLFQSALFDARRIEEITDDAAPPLQPGIEVLGGTEFFKNQAACPFRAFAVHRLKAVGLENAHVGLDAGDRGLLVHRAAENFWNEMQNSARLNAAADEELNSVVGRAVAGALEFLRKRRPDVVTPAFAALEQQRVSALLLQFIQLEKARPLFELVAREESRPVTVAGITVSTRPDRVDRLADGSRVILDYKTGKNMAVGDWLGERPDEPQLPLYAVSAGRDDVAAVAFVQLHAQGVQFKGLSREKDLLPGVATLAETRGVPQQSWPELFESWRAMLENLAREYLDGRAAVAPKKYPDTCKYCDLGTFCRVKEIMERGPVMADEEGNGE